MYDIILGMQSSNALTTLYMDNFIKTVKEYSNKVCVYALMDRENQKIYISFTVNLLGALDRIFKQLDYSNKVFERPEHLELVVLEQVVDRANLRARYRFWCDDYSNKGWLLYKRPTNVPTYKVRMDFMSVDLPQYDGEVFFGVKLVSRNRSERIVGLFTSAREGYQWVQNAYKNKSNVTDIVYADNKWTKEYLDAN